MDIFEARWNNAKNRAEIVNKLFGQGFLVFWGNYQIESPVVISDKEIKIQTTETPVEEVIGQNRYYGSPVKVSLIIFVKDKQWDEGMFTSVADFNKKFPIKAYSPIPVVV